MTEKATIHLTAVVEAPDGKLPSSALVAEHLTGFGVDESDPGGGYWLPDVLPSIDRQAERLATYTDEARLIRDEIRALSDGDLEKEVAFADSFVHAKDGSAERAWRLELRAEQTGREYAALLAFGSELWQAGNHDGHEGPVESDLARKGAKLVAQFRQHILLFG